MIWEWPISFRSKCAPLAGGCLLLVLNSAPMLLAAVITGRVEMTNVSKRSADRSSGDKSGQRANAVIWLDAIGAPARPAVRRHVTMLQEDKRFTPHLLAIQAGWSVDFPNLDPIFHNAFSNFNGKVFDIGLYAPGSSRSVRFDRPGVVRVFCNIHPSMSAVIVVVDSPNFTTTTPDGAFSISDLAGGEYRVHFFHERATPETLDKLTRTISVKDKTDLSTVEISEAGYLPVAHTNKYGRDYPKDSESGKNYSLPLK